MKPVKFVAIILVALLLACCTPQTPPAPDPTPDPTPDPPSAPPTVKPEILMSYEEYFSVDREIDITESNVYGIEMPDPNSVRIFLRTDETQTVMQLDNQSLSSFLISGNNLYIIKENAIYELSFITGEEEVIYEGTELTEFNGASDCLGFFVDNNQCVRLHFPSRTAEVFFESDRVGSFYLLNNNTVVVSVFTDRIMGDGSGEYAHDYYRIYIPTLEVTKTSWEELIA